MVFVFCVIIGCMMDALSAAQPDMLNHAFLRGALQQTHFENELIFKETAAD